MAELNKNTKRTVAITLLLILLAVLLRKIWCIVDMTETLVFIADSLRSLIYIGMFAAWGISAWQRIIQTHVRNYLVGISALMVFWMIARSMKYLCFDGTHIGRYCWYLYYFPMLFIPPLVLFVALSLGRTENFRPQRLANSFFLISAVFLLLVLTNDLHQLIFRLPNGLLRYENDEYTHEMSYFIIMGWIVLCSVASIGVIFAKSRAPGSKNRIYQPCIFLAIIAAYGTLYVTVPDFVIPAAGDMTVVSCLLVTAALESCIQSGLIQSNTHYNDLFSSCRVSAVIVDGDYNTQYATATDLKLSRKQMQEAQRNTVEINGGTILESMPLDDGHIFWLEDVSELRKLEKKLESNAAVLSEETELLSEEVRQKEEKAITDVRNRLYDTVAREIAPQIAEINRLISQRPDGAEARRKTLEKMCVLGAYVKRCCNLIILNEQQKTVSSMELYNCLQESAEYIIQYGVPCSVDNTVQNDVRVENAKLAYDYFETVVENALETLTALSANIFADEEKLELRLMAECAGVDLDQSDVCCRIRQLGGHTETDYEDGVWYYTLILTEGEMANA